MSKKKLTILTSENKSVEKGRVKMKRGLRTIYKSVYRLLNEKEWRYLDSSKVVKGIE